MEQKPFWESKSLWVNVITGLAGIIALVDPELIGIDPRWLLLASGSLNIILRLLTTGGQQLTATRRKKV